MKKYNIDEQIFYLNQHAEQLHFHLGIQEKINEIVKGEREIELSFKIDELEKHLEVIFSILTELQGVKNLHNT